MSKDTMTPEELMKWYQEQFAAAGKTQKAGVCPSCGHCETCGRGGHHLAPWVVPMPMPSYPWQYYQPYPQPYQVWCGTRESGGLS